MKCPKCSYLGFETGDRCKNCGYDFSLMTNPVESGDYASNGTGTAGVAARNQNASPDRAGWPGRDAVSDPLGAMPLDTVVAPAASVRAAGARSAAARQAMPPLPLFHPGAADDDQPLITLPAKPRAPLAVRRTPDKPRLRTMTKRVVEADDVPLQPLAEPEPILQFVDELADAPLHREAPIDRRRAAVAPVSRQSSGPARRLIAAGIDHLILFAIDAVVIYFTLKMAALTTADWRLLPPVPLAAFLMMVKGAYFCAFTLVGGQTVGKMAARIRVVTDDNREVDPTVAVRRTLAGTVSFLTLGLAFIPIVFSADRRAIHDRVAGTRVIALPSE